VRTRRTLRCAPEDDIPRNGGLHDWFLVHMLNVTSARMRPLTLRRLRDTACASCLSADPALSAFACRCGGHYPAAACSLLLRPRLLKRRVLPSRIIARRKKRRRKGSAPCSAAASAPILPRQPLMPRIAPSTGVWNGLYNAKTTEKRVFSATWWRRLRAERCAPTPALLARRLQSRLLGQHRGSWPPFPNALFLPYRPSQRLILCC